MISCACRHSRTERVCQQTPENDPTAVPPFIPGAHTTHLRYGRPVTPTSTTASCAPAASESKRPDSTVAVSPTSAASASAAPAAAVAVCVPCPPRFALTCRRARDCAFWCWFGRDKVHVWLCNPIPRAASRRSRRVRTCAD